MDTEGKDLTYSEAIERVMLANGGYAPLSLIYREIWKHKDRSRIRGKTPDMTVQERVQRDSRFTRIGLGVYAISNRLDKLPQEPVATTKREKAEKRHTAIQGMLLEIGNNTPDIVGTYTHDKSGIFKNKELGRIATMKHLPSFTYKQVVESARFVDAIWFNDRGYPAWLFEVEHSTNFRDALTKFCALQDFHARFCCVADESRKDKFNRECGQAAFCAIKDRCDFFTYEQVETDYQTRMRSINIK